MAKLIKHDPLKMILGVTQKYVSFLAPTFGPAGKKILVADSPFSLKAVDDGKEGAKGFEMEEELENAVASYIKEASEKTDSRVGDGTTTAALIAGSIVEQVLKDLDDPLSDKIYHRQEVEIQKAALEAVQYIKDHATPINTQEDLYKIAYNSFNNTEIARLISKTLFEIGQDGVLTIDNANGLTSSVERVQGLEIGRGFMSPYFVNTEKQEVVMNSPSVFLFNRRLDSFMDLVPVMQQLQGREFVFIAQGFSEDVIKQVILNQAIKGRWKANLVELPVLDKDDICKDLSVVLGAKIIDENTKWAEITLDDSGKADEIRSTKDKTIIKGGKGTEVQVHLETLKALNPESNFEKDKLKRRIAALQDGIAVLKIGANTENEQKSIKAKAEDAVNATKIAFKDGVVKGAGMTYADIKTSSEILNEALKAPRKQLEANGKEFLDEDVVDPAGVLIAALESGVSIGCGLITIGGISTFKEEKKDD